MVLSDLDDVDVNDGAEIMSYSGLDTNFWLVGDCAADRERETNPGLVTRTGLLQAL